MDRRFFGCTVIGAIASFFGIKTAKAVEKRKAGVRVTESILHVVKVPHEGSLVYIVITDSTWFEDGHEKINRAWHVFEKEEFFNSLGGRRYRNKKARFSIAFPSKVRESLDKFPGTLKKWHQFHLFEMQQF